MHNVRLIQDYRDAHHRPTRRTIADGLARLERELGSRPKMGCCHLHAPSQPGRPAKFAVIWFRPEEGQDIVIAYPFSKGCWARTPGARTYLTLDELDGARLDQDGNVALRDGRSVHALTFDIVPLPRDFSDLEHAIVLLTARFLNAEEKCVRCYPEIGFHWIDYSSVPQLSVNNVKELARYIDANIGDLLRAPGGPSLGRVSLRKIQSTLNLAGIRKVRGRKPKMAA